MTEEIPTIVKAMKPVEIYTAIADICKGQSCQDITRALRFLIDDVERKQYSDQYAKEASYQKAQAGMALGLTCQPDIQRDIKF